MFPGSMQKAAPNYLLEGIEAKNIITSSHFPLVESCSSSEVLGWVSSQDLWAPGMSEKSFGQKVGKQEPFPGRLAQCSIGS